MARLVPFAVLLLSVAAAPLRAAGPDDAGKKVFAQCAACHKIDSSGKSGIGPNLHGVVGRISGTLPGFGYSPAMVKAKRKWTPSALDAYLAGPMAAIPGNKMPFAGLKNAEDRKRVIDYIQAMSR